MIISDLKPGPELDAAVAKACGLKGCFESLGRCNVPSDNYEQWLHPGEVSAASPLMSVRFEPSADLNAAFEAAEKVGIFNGDHFPFKGTNGRWTIGKLTGEEENPGSPNYATPTAGGYETAALAICAAIISLKGAQ